jgi:Secretion system C-terminal sorting domain
MGNALPMTAIFSMAESHGSFDKKFTILSQATTIHIMNRNLTSLQTFHPTINYSKTNRRWSFFRKLACSSCICLFYLAIMQSAYGQWVSDPSSNTPVSGVGGGSHSRIISNGVGGSIITWFANNRIYAQNLNEGGIIQWPAGGIEVAQEDPGQQVDPTIISDGADGAIIAWVDLANGNDIHAQRIDATGIMKWTGLGVAVCTAAGSQTSPVIVSDGAGGAIITWDDNRAGGNLYAQRINGSGVVQWAENGVPVSLATNAQVSSAMTADGAGGAIMVWQDSRNDVADIYAQRINADGTMQWSTDGIAIATVTGSQSAPAISDDGAGGAIISWVDGRSGSADIYAQRVGPSGTMQWTNNGISICSSTGTQALPAMTTDGSGGAVITWDDNRSGTGSDIYAQRVNTSGIVLWSLDGVAISTASNSQAVHAITTDGASGAIIAWMDDRNGNNDIYAQRISASGGLQWTINGVAIATPGDNQSSPAIANDGLHGAVITWENPPSALQQVFAQNINDDGTLGLPNIPPVVTSLQVSSGYVGSKTIINGTNFSGATAVKIGGIDVLEFNINSSTAITAWVGRGTGTVSVTTPVATGTSTDIYTSLGYINNMGSTSTGNDWYTGATWLGGQVPFPGATITISGPEGVDIKAPVVNTGIINIDSGSGMVLRSSFTNNGVLNVKGLVGFFNPAVFSGNTPLYTNTSILSYKLLLPADIGAEWTSNDTVAGPGVPAKVRINGTVNMPGTDLGIGGNLELENGIVNLHADLYVAGDVISDPGTVNLNGNSLILSGSANQTILAEEGANEFEKLVVDKPGGTLTAPDGLTVTGTLTLTNGTIVIPDSSSLRVSGDINRTNGYVIGNIIRNVEAGTHTYMFPVGTTDGYTPANFTLNGVTAGGDFKVKAVDSKSVNYPASFSTTKYLDRSWTVTTGITFADADATFNFIASDLVGGVSPAELRAFKYNGSFNFPVLADFSIDGSTYSFSNITSFSEFGAGVPAMSLPVTLVSFAAAALPGNKAGLTWTTSSEINFSHFVAEKSINGVDFIPLGIVEAKGNNSSYYLGDILQEGITYYRLAMVDIDGHREYSDVVKVANRSVLDQLTVFPNPANGTIVIGHARAGSAASILITGMNGTRILTRQVAKDALQTSIDLGRLPAGNYILIYYNEGKKQQTKFVRQ